MQLSSRIALTGQWKKMRRFCRSLHLKILAVIILFAILFTTHDSISLQLCITPSVKAFGAEDLRDSVKSLQHRIRLDSTQTYIIQQYAIIGENWNTVRDTSLCLATQTSVAFLHHLVTQSLRWQGLMSVAVFVPNVDFSIAQLLLDNIRHCHPEVMANATFHFVYPLKYQPIAHNNKWLDVHNCSAWNLDMLKRVSFDASRILYPQNLLRNVASKSCPVDHVLVADVDIVPSVDLAPRLGAFLDNKSQCRKCVYIIPAYEVGENASLPNNKVELLELVKLELARPYHQEAFSKNQGATNATRWQQLPTGDAIDIGYSLTCFDFYYEPFYLTGEPVPSYDERFVGYGFTRNTQAYETQLAGYRFFVLDNAFVVQHNMARYRFTSRSRDAQVEYNRKHYSCLKREFSVKYPTNMDDLPCSINS